MIPKVKNNNVSHGAVSNFLSRNIPTTSPMTMAKTRENPMLLRWKTCLMSFLSLSFTAVYRIALSPCQVPTPPYLSYTA